MGPFFTAWPNNFLVLFRYGLMFYLVVETAFAALYFLVMVPRTNQRRVPSPYRVYGKDRRRLLLRILERIEETCKMRKIHDTKGAIVSFLKAWFEMKNVPVSGEAKKLDLACVSLMSCSSASSSAESSDSECRIDREYPVDLCKEDLDSFFAWAFFAKNVSEFLPWELNELDNLYKVLEQRHGLTFQKKDVHASSLYHPRRMTLEALKPFYRPLLVYAIFMVFKYFGKLALYAYGFRRYVTANGLVSWYRPAKIESEKSFLPMLFFHGIAPGGVTGYLPMILHGLATEKERPVLLFENKSISLVLDFNFLDEQQTVDGVIETLERFGHTNRPLSLVGHSFGSCPIAWLITSKQLRNIKQIVLLDPVAISLSEPDVMENFLYSEENPMIRMLASSELSIQYYLRRIFAWYNSELYISDVDCPILVCLSEQDNIVPSRKVKQEMERHDAPAPENKLLYWKGAGHGACITNPKKWKQIKGLMLEQELMIFQGRS